MTLPLTPILAATLCLVVISCADEPAKAQTAEDYDRDFQTNPPNLDEIAVVLSDEFQNCDLARHGDEKCISDEFLRQMQEMRDIIDNMREANKAALVTAQWRWQQKLQAECRDGNPDGKWNAWCVSEAASERLAWLRKIRGRNGRVATTRTERPRAVSAKELSASYRRFRPTESEVSPFTSPRYRLCMNRAKSTMDMVRCGTEENDQQLTSMDHSISSMSTEIRATLTQLQSAWLTKRSDNCRSEARREYANGSMASIHFSSCNVAENARRWKWLIDLASVRPETNGVVSSNGRLAITRPNLVGTWGMDAQCGGSWGVLFYADGRWGGTDAGGSWFLRDGVLYVRTEEERDDRLDQFVQIRSPRTDNWGRVASLSDSGMTLDRNGRTLFLKRC